jgi:uncharacterized protein with von Willebrand factor type A (vWA) domain
VFIDFFYSLRDQGLPVSPTAFLTLHRAMAAGLVGSLEDFYTASRAILVKSERWFDLFDRVFAHHFRGADLPDPRGLDIDELARSMLESWLQRPEEAARLLGVDARALQNLTPAQLLDYFKERLKDQDGPHHGGGKWIGTSGHSPVGHSGHHPQGLRVGGQSGRRSAVKVALERRYRDYSQEGPLTQAHMGEALKRLRHMTPSGPKDRVNIEATIRRTARNAGEVDIVFDRALKDKLKVVLAVDNGGWSMDPYIPLVQTLFDYARSQFKDVKTVFFHNTVYSTLWADPGRRRKPLPIEEFSRLDPATRLVLVGDASMAPFELLAQDGSIYAEERSGKPSIECLRFLARTFPRSVWLNPKPAHMWPYTRSIAAVRGIFQMHELTLDGLEQAVAHLMRP